MAGRSSLIGKLETDVEIKASAEKFHQIITDRPHHVTKAAPSKIQGVVLQEGELGKLGAIVIWNFVLDGKAQVVKNKLEALDREKKLLKVRVIEGDIMKEHKSFAFTMQVTNTLGGSGGIVHWDLEYEKINEEVAPPETLLQFVAELSKEVGEHLLTEE